MPCCNDIEAFLQDIPPTFRKGISSAICSLIPEDLNCDTVKKCETLTSFSNFTINGTNLGLTYWDENKQPTYREISIAPLLNISNNLTLNGRLLTSTVSGQESSVLLPEVEQISIEANCGIDLAFNEGVYTLGVKISTDEGNTVGCGDDGGLFVTPPSVINGLRVEGASPYENYIKLGGPLIENTTLSGAYKLVIPDGQVGIGVDAANTLNKLTVVTSTLSAAVSGDNYATSLDLSRATIGTSGLFILGGTGNLGVGERSRAGVLGRFQTTNTGAYSLSSPEMIPLTGVLGSLVLGSVMSGKAFVDTTVSSIATRLNLANTASYNKVAGLHVTIPTEVFYTEYGETQYSGTVDEYSSILINTKGRNKVFGLGSATKTYGIKQTGDVSNWFQGHVSISEQFDPENSVSLANYPNAQDRPRLNVYKVAGYSLTTGSAASVSMAMIGSGSDTGTTDGYNSFGSGLYWAFNSNQVNEKNRWFSAIKGEIGIESDFNHTGGILSGLVSNLVAIPATTGTKGTIQHYAGFRASFPKQGALAYSQGRIFAGITNAYGLYIDNQRLDGLGIPITNSWGVYQEGPLDRNYFQAQVGIGTNAPSPSAKLQIDSTSQGILIPRMTTGQRDGIPSKVGGLLIYNTDTEEFQYWKASINNWVSL